MTKTPLLRALRDTAGRSPHPHLSPINALRFDQDRKAALAKTVDLLAYRRFLAEARDAKARRKDATAAFERGVQAQGRAALANVEEMAGGTLRVVQQINGTDLWPQMHRRMSAVLSSRGPVGVSEAWKQVDAVLREPAHQAALRSAGLTEELRAALGDAFGKQEARLSLQDGRITLETKAPGDRKATRLSLRTPGAKPSGILDLLTRSQFDRVAADFGDPSRYLEAAGSAGATAIAPHDIFAIAAVASRRRVAEHVRKLEDTGLATYAGDDPTTLILGLLIAGLIASLIGAGILYLCDDLENAELHTEPNFVCDAGFWLLFLGTIALGVGLVAGGIILGGPGGLVVLGLALGAYGPLYKYMLDHAPFSGGSS